MIMLISLSFFSCSKSELKQEKYEETHSIQLETNYLKPISTDSFIVDSGSGMYYDRIPNLDRDQYLRNQLFVMGRSEVTMGIVDSTGSFKQHITKKGNGPGEILAARSAKAWQSKDGGLYVLSNANVFMLYVFDRNSNFRYSLRLFEALPDYFHQSGTSFHFSEHKDGIFYLTLAIGSKLESPFQQSLYEKRKGIARFEINEYQQKIVSVKTFLPYSELPEIKESLKNDNVCWYGQEPIFQIVDDKIYLTYSFSNEVYVLDNKFKMIQRIKLNALTELREVKKCVDFVPKMPDNLYDRTYLQFELYLSNLHITDLQVLDDLIILQFVKPLQEKDFLSKFPTREEAMDIVNYQGFFQTRDKYWLVFNTTNGKEELIRLSPEHKKGVFLAKNRLLVEREFDNIEDRYLMKYTLPEAIGQ